MPTLSITEYNELLAARRERDELRQAKLLAPLIAAFADNMLVILANRPFAAWSHEAQTAFDAAAARMPMAAAIYKSKLPLIAL